MERKGGEALTFGSLFAGIGGFDLGFTQAGMRCLWRSEIDEKCNVLMDERIPGILKLGDVRNVTKEAAATPDVICGGFPCQDLSVAGKRAGLAGKRSGLWYEFHRVLGELRPRWAVIENVPGLLSSNGGRDFAVILRGLAEIGYLSAWRVLDAQYYGVAQRRRRVFVVASLGNGGCAQVLFEPEGLSWDTAPGREAGEGVAAYACRRAQTSSNGWGIQEEVTHTLDNTGGDVVAFQQNTRDEVRLIADPITASPYADNEAQHRKLVIGFEKSRGQYTGDIAAPLQVKGGQSPGVNDGKADNQCVAISQWGDVAGTLSRRHNSSPCADRGQNVVAFDIRNQSETGDTTHPLQSNESGGYSLNYQPVIGFTERSRPVGSFGVRRLTPTECERLQGFPEIKKRVIIDVCLDQQKNYASVEIRNHKLQRPVLNVGKTESSNVAQSVVQNLSQKNQVTSRLAQPIVHISCGERKVEIHNQEKLLLSVSIAEKKNESVLPIPIEDFVHLLAGLISTVEKITPHGKVESQAKERYLIHQPNGEMPVKLSGNGITQFVRDAEKDLTTDRRLLKYIILSPLNIKNIEHKLITSCSYVLNVITGYILPEILNANSFKIEITTRFGWTYGQSDSARYRQLGNAVCVPVAEWIGQRIVEYDERR